MSRSQRRIRGLAVSMVLLGSSSVPVGCATDSLPANGTVLQDDSDLASKRRASYAKAYDPKGRPTGQRAVGSRSRKPKTGWSLPR